MSALSKCRIRISLGFAFGASLVTWLVLGDTSPFKEYFIHHVTVPNMLRQLLIVPYLILTILNPDVFGDAIGYLLEFLQWLLIGYLLARLICKE